MSRNRAIFLTSLFLLVGTLHVSSYTECATFTQENFEILPHPKISTFSRNASGVWSGTTVDGKTFTQYPIPNTYGLRIERFVIDDYAHYVVEGDIIYSLQDLSIRLALATEQPHV